MAAASSLQSVPGASAEISVPPTVSRWIAKLAYVATGRAPAPSKYTTGNSGSVGPAGRTMLGLSLPGFQPTEPSRMWKRRLNASPSTRPDAAEILAGASRALASRTLWAIRPGSFSM